MKVVVIITGGATNIGKVIALSFAKEGSKVAIIDIKEKEGKETLKELEQYSEGLFINTDIIYFCKHFTFLIVASLILNNDQIV